MLLSYYEWAERIRDVSLWEQWCSHECRLLVSDSSLKINRSLHLIEDNKRALSLSPSPAYVRPHARRTDIRLQSASNCVCATPQLRNLFAFSESRAVTRAKHSNLSKVCWNQSTPPHRIYFKTHSIRSLYLLLDIFTNLGFVVPCIFNHSNKTPN